jgi:hypothetical protein
VLGIATDIIFNEMIFQGEKGQVWRTWEHPSFQSGLKRLASQQAQFFRINVME